MLTVTSVSGGKSSAYMALHYPTDFYVFCCVLTNDLNCTPKDKGLLRECQKRLPFFEGSRELDQTLVNLLRLEQEIGKEIKWISAEMTYDDIIKKRKMLPTRNRRFCTQELKIIPLSQYFYSYLFDEDNVPPLTNIGFRFDEKTRVNKMSDCDQAKYQISLSCKITNAKGVPLKKKCHNWSEIEWRIPCFPLFNDGVTKSDVIRFWDKKGWVFPNISNCDFCFNHTEKEIREQFKLYPERADWWIEQEKSFANINRNRPFSFKDRPLKEILKTDQLDLFLDGDISCDCTD